MLRCRLACFGAFFAGLAVPAAAQNPQVSPWWVGVDAGYGQLRFTSGQSSATGQGTFALGFMGGHSIGKRARIGFELNGWLQQAYNYNDPTVGESVSNAVGILDVFPTAHAPLFVRVGVGAAMYTNFRPEGVGGKGWSGTAGLGYEIPLSKSVAVVPVFGYAAGRLGSARTYSVFEGKAGLVWHFGRR